MQKDHVHLFTGFGSPNEGVQAVRKGKPLNPPGLYSPEGQVQYFVREEGEAGQVSDLKCCAFVSTYAYISPPSS